jgi:hypothetical protein
MTAPADEKYCKSCGSSKPLSEWHYFPHRKGYHSICKQCQNERGRADYARKRKEILLKQRQYRKTPEGKQVSSRGHYKSMAKDPAKHLARYKARYAVSRGRLKKSDCLECGSPKVEAHHYLGYEPEHWYDVLWLCRKHHWDAHQFSLESRGKV